MTTFLALTVLGLVFGCVYALSASGIVVTYTTSGVFNFAHGATGMLAAFAYWQLTVAWHWPQLAGLVVVLFVLAPLFGAVVERILIRPLYGRSAEVSLVATLGLLLTLVGISYSVWRPTQYRSLPLFFHGHHLHVIAINVSYHELTIIVVTLAVGVALRLFFARTRTGIAMRAVVDDPDLVAMNGVSAARIGQLSWALGSSMAALAGILLAPLVTMDVLTLTLLIINAFAAALAGRLKSLPLTVAGAIVLQLVVVYSGNYLPATTFYQHLEPAIPMIFLFVIVVVTKQDRLRTSTGLGALIPRVPGVRQSLVAAVGLVVATIVISGSLDSIQISRLTAGMATAFVLLSMVLLTGYGGQVSLCQLTFVGIGAYVMGHLGRGGSLVGVLLAGLITAAVGVAVALPTLRLRGLYLALATLAFAQAMDTAFFSHIFGSTNSLVVPRIHLPGLHTTSDRGYLYLVTALFAAAGIGLLALRRSRYGRLLTALNDSPAACATLGIDVNRGKLAVFGLSAGMAGVGGALYGGAHAAVSSSDFVLLNSLVLLLLLLLGGRNTIVGALAGALVFAVFFPALKDALAGVPHLPDLSQLQFLLTGVGVASLGRNPNGLGGLISQAGDRLRAMLGHRRVVEPRRVLTPAEGSG
jgi:branched-chain amino acid transport system permease protein